jgi:hypothetical protein
VARELTQEDLGHLSKVVIAIFHRWSINGELQLRLLGFAPGTAVTELQRLREGEPFPAGGERLERAQHLLAIDDGLRTAYPRNSNMAAHWLRQPHRRIDSRAPLAVMLEEGLSGLRTVRGLLDCTQNWV